MSLDLGKEELFREFLVELQALDDFRSEYARRYDFEGLGRDDQDVRRLMEAMAFYCARTRGGAERAMQRYKLRALEQLFPHLLSPMPAMGLLYPVITSNMTETRCLPRTAEIQVASGAPPAFAAAGDVAPPRLFRAARDTRVFPLFIVEHSVRVDKTGPDTHALFLSVAASPTGSESKRYYDDPERPLKELVLHFNPQGDVLLALRLFDALSESSRGVNVRFLAAGLQRHELLGRRLGVGLDTSQDGGWQNPIELARRWIHFPLSELRVSVPLPHAPAEWTRLEIEIELGPGWPPSLAVSDQALLLNAGAIENLVRRNAEPIDADGTRLRHRLEHQGPRSGMKVRDVLGVYLGDPAQPGARRALLPSAVAGAGYTIEIDGCGPTREVWLETDAVLGEAGKPERLYVDAEWYAPDPLLPNAREARVSVEDHELGALIWRVADPLRAPSESSFLGNAKALDRLLELHGRRLSSTADLELLLRALGVAESEVFRRVPRYIDALDVTLLPDVRAAWGSLRSYDVRLGQLPPVLIPAARLLFRLLPGILGVWTGDTEVRVSVTLDALGAAPPMVFEWRANHAE